LTMLANAPIMLMLSVFTMLLYHTFIVAHSIHLSYESALNRSASGALSIGSPLAGFNGVASISPTQSEANLGDSSPLPRANSWRAGQLLTPSPTWSSQRRRCIPQVPFWVVLCGRHHSSIKLFMIALNMVLWISFVASMVVDSGYLFTVEFPRRHHALAADLLELPIIATAVVISVCFLVSGTKLLMKLRNLRHMLRFERQHEQGSLDATTDMPDESSTPCTVHELDRSCQSVDALSNGSSMHTGGAIVRLSPTQTSPDNGSVAKSPAVGVQDVARLNSTASPCTSVCPGARTSRLSYRTRSRVTFSTLTASLTLVYDEPSVVYPGVYPVICGVKRMLIVIIVCLGAFLFRATIITLIVCGTQAELPRRMWLPYLLVSEVLPYALLLFFYIIPGCQALYLGSGGCCGWRRRTEPGMHSASERCERC
jgi:hypothetical protein